MKVLTKEWLKDLELHDLRCRLTPNSNIKIPLVFTNGGTDSIAKEDLHTVKTNLNVSGKENEISFIMVPDTFMLDTEYLKDAVLPDVKSVEDDFLMQYINVLRIITYLPDNLLKCVKDKRLLALGYAEEELKKEIIDYINIRHEQAKEKWNKNLEDFDCASDGLTICKQLIGHTSLPFVEDVIEEKTILKAERVGKDIYLSLDNDKTIILNDAEIIEEEADTSCSYTIAAELYNNEAKYELHLLIMKRDKNLICSHYYTTYRFSDMKFKI